MPSPATLFRRLRLLVRLRRAERDMDDEMRHHVAMETADRIRAGASPGEARRAALLAFGGVERYKEAGRDARGVRALEDIGADLRLALRGLRRSPAFTITATLTLALGIGATTAVFSAARTVFLAPLPYPAPERLVRIFQQNSPINRWTISNADWQAIRAQQRSFESVAAYRSGGAALALGDRTEWVIVGWVTEDFFRTLGVRFTSGAGFQPGDDAPGAPRKVVVSEDFVELHLGAGDALGRTVTLDGLPYTVAGVLPRGSRRLADIQAGVWPILQLAAPERRGPFGMRAVGRLREGATIASATSDLAAISERIFPIWASSFQDETARLTPHALHDVIVGDAARPLRILAAAVALVLLIAIVDVANLALVRALGRTREMAVRTALGAQRSRLARLLLTESLVLGAAGGVLGAGVAVLGLGALRVLGPDIPRLDEVRPDAAFVALALGAALASGALVGLYPALAVMRRSLTSSMRGGDRRTGTTRGTRLFQGTLVATEFALALPLLLGAGLLLHSFVRLQRVDVGFDPRNIVTALISLPPSAYAAPQDRLRFWDDALRRVREIPGVQAVALMSSLPPNNGGDTNNFDLVDEPVEPGGAQHVVPWAWVSPDLFDALGVPLLAGRGFRESENPDVPVAVVSRAWARRWFPGESPIGRRLYAGGCRECEPTTVIGVVGDVKYSGLRAGAEAVYEPVTQGPMPALNLVVRTGLPAASALAAVRERLRALDPRVPVRGVATMEERVAAEVADPRRMTWVIGVFAGVAVLLAAMGVFGVMSYAVAEQRREIGVRIALGADRPAVMGMVMRRGMTRAAAGLAAGIAVALAGSRVLEAALFEVSATDPLMLSASGAMLLAVAIVACWIPGRRAAGIRPVEVLGGE